MFFAKYLASILTNKKETIPDMSITPSIRIKFIADKFPINSFIAAAAPVLVFEIAYKEINEKDMTKIFVAPSKTKNPLLSVFATRFPITAAWPEPKPGRKPHKGEEINAPAMGLVMGTFSV